MRVVPVWADAACRGGILGEYPGAPVTELGVKMDRSQTAAAMPQRKPTDPTLIPSSRAVRSGSGGNRTMFFLPVSMQGHTRSVAHVVGHQVPQWSRIRLAFRRDVVPREAGMEEVISSLSDAARRRNWVSAQGFPKR